MTFTSRTYLSFLLALLFLVFAADAGAQTLKNPLTVENEWTGYSIGDPYVLKHRGYYYLYCSTKDAETGIKCWSSKDLIAWKYEGLCATDPLTKGAYAPEVIYRNGTFYMYTSPAGNGHYVLASPSPTGPFEIITGNLGKSIDGSVFIDDDDKMYFYHASGSGIQGCPMSSPSNIGADINLGARMNNSWTEGPCVFKRNGKYYMIYTGNHVISRGYRIDYATNGTGPIDTYHPAENQNPILLDALGMHTGLGHGSIFIGPDLDSYILTYHNLVSNIGPFRRLNFDRLIWNGEKMLLPGITTYYQEDPALPDAYDFFERTDPGSGWLFTSGGTWMISENGILNQGSIQAGGSEPYKALLDSISEENYTAEFCFKETGREDNTSLTGVIFNYLDEENFGTAQISASGSSLIVTLTSSGVPGTPVEASLMEGFDLQKWHTLRIESFNGRYRFYIDGSQKLSIEETLPGGRIGYLTYNTTADFGFIAFSNKVNGSATFDLHKPVPGKIPAMQYNRGGEGLAFHSTAPVTPSPEGLRSDEVATIPANPGGYALASLKTGEWFNYNINVETSGLYNAVIRYNSTSDNARIRILADDTDLTGSVALPATDGSWKSFVVSDLQLPSGFHTLKIEVLQGEFHFYEMEYVYADNAAFDELISFDGSFGSGWKYYDGTWEIKDKTAFIDGFGKRAYGSEYWRNYTVETDIKFSRSMNAGLIFRVNNTALGGAGDDPAAGTDYLQGYFVGFNFGTVVLGKHNYGWKQLATSPGSFIQYNWYHLRVTVIDDRIRVYVDDMTTPLIDYTDPDPLINGMAGMRSFNTGVAFDNFRVCSDILTSAPDDHPVAAEEGKPLLIPNPADGDVRILFPGAGRKNILIYDSRGILVKSMLTGEQSVNADLSELSPGLFFIRTEDENHSYTQKLIKK